MGHYDIFYEAEEERQRCKRAAEFGISSDETLVAMDNPYFPRNPKFVSFSSYPVNIPDKHYLCIIKTADLKEYWALKHKADELLGKLASKAPKLINGFCRTDEGFKLNGERLEYGSKN